MSFCAVIPTIGRRDYLDLSIASLVQQIAFDEIVVFDNSPEQNLREASRWKGHSRLRWVLSGGGVPAIASWNGCVRACRTDWVTIFGDDDIAGPDFAARMREHTDGNALVYAPFYLIDEQGARHPQKPVIPVSGDHHDFRHRRMRGDLYCVIPGFAFRRREFESVGGFRTLGMPKDLYCDDDLWFRLSAVTKRVTVVPQRTWSYRRHGAQVGRKFDLGRFVDAFDGFANQLETALSALGVPTEKIYPPELGALGYRRRLLGERYRLWLREEQRTALTLLKEVTRLPLPLAQRFVWSLIAVRFLIWKSQQR